MDDAWSPTGNCRKKSGANLLAKRPRYFRVPAVVAKPGIRDGGDPVVVRAASLTAVSALEGLPARGGMLVERLRAEAPPGKGELVRTTRQTAARFPRVHRRSGRR